MGLLELNWVCRLCVQILEKENVSPIFNNEAYLDKISISERIKYCSSVEVTEGDGLPPQICNSCLLKLNQSFVFRNQCALADITLKQLKDVSVSVSEVSNLLKIDIENEIIKGPQITTQILEWESIKEKNERLREKTESRKQTSAENNEHIPEKGNFKKNKKSLVYFRGKKAAKKAEFEVAKGEISHDEEVEVESFMIEPDLPELNESLESCVEGSKIDCMKKVKCKSVREKKGRMKKMSGAKEKPNFYMCKYCQKVYPSEGGWRYHIHTMHNENYQPFICDLCGKSFKVKKNLECHKNSIHFHIKQHLCDLCGRGFASRYALKVHKIWHNDEKNYTCDICGTKFRTRGKMNTHKSIHGGPKKFMCHICSRDFRWKKDFEIHVRTHTGEKPFKCSHCGKAFASLTNMKKHERNHLGKGGTVKKGEVCEFSEFEYGSEDMKNGADGQPQGILD